jgi:uncharacterized protein YkwD
MHKFSTAIALATLVAFATPSVAQTTAPTPPAKAAAAPASPAAKTSKQIRTAKSLECSKEADVKKIHGKERRKFMSSCKKA